ncbi:MAG: SCO family protein [Pseudomonadota bacterium]
MNSQAKPSDRTIVSARSIALALVGAFSLAIAGCTGEPIITEEPPLAGADIGGDFELEGPSGEKVRWSDFEGQYRIVYFGYAYCPDICPTDVQRMTKGLDIASKNKPDMLYSITPMFITIDPERDTRDVIDQFTAAFSDRLIGLTGTPEEVRAAADEFRVYYERGEEVDGGGYLVNHSNIVYLFDKDGKPLATLPVDQGPEAVAAEIEKWVS